LTGTFGYLTFGTGVNSDILKSYPPDDPLVIAARVLMAVAMVTRYCINHRKLKMNFSKFRKNKFFFVKVVVFEKML